MSGIIVIPILVIYTFFCYIVYRIVLGKTQKWLFSVSIFFAVLTFPFWDLMVQQGIKSFYETFNLLEPTIYEMPQRDKDGKIESIGSSFTHFIHFKDLKNKEALNNLLQELRKDNISEFVEFDSSIGDSRNNTYKEFIVKLNLYNEEIPYEIIEKSQARYVMQNTYKFNFSFLGIHLFKSEQVIYDTKLQKAIAKSSNMIGFYVLLMRYIRKNIFHLRASDFSPSTPLIDGVDYRDAMVNQVFKNIKAVR